MGTPLVPPSNARPPDSPSSSSKISPSHSVTFLPTPRPRKSFSGNTYGFPRKCCKQKTYGKAKSFSCNTYKKQGGGGPALRIRQGCARRGSLPLFFVSVAAKEVSSAISLLFATLAGRSISVAAKGLTRTECWRESNWVRAEDSEGVRRTTWRAGMVRRARSFPTGP